MDKFVIKLVERKLRQIEHILLNIENPERCTCNMNGQGRDILPNVKIKEAKMLHNKIAETQEIIDDIEDKDFYYEYQSRLNELESIRQTIICPVMETIIEM